MDSVLHPSYNENMKRLIGSLAAVGVIVAVLCGGCHYLNVRVGLPDNNPIEEALEDVIEAQTGVQINLSGTPED